MHKSLYMPLALGLVLSFLGLAYVIQSGTSSSAGSESAEHAALLDQESSHDSSSKPGEVSFLKRLFGSRIDSADASAGVPNVSVSKSESEQGLEGQSPSSSGQGSALSKDEQQEADSESFKAGGRSIEEVDAAGNVVEFQLPVDRSDEALAEIDAAITADKKATAKEVKEQKKAAAAAAKAAKANRPVLTPMEAFDQAMAKLGSDNFSLGHVNRAISAMEASDFPDAATQLRELEWNRESHYMMNELMEQWGKNDLDSALKFADQMDIRRMQNDAVKEAMNGWASHNPEAAYNMLRAGEEQNELAEHLSASKVFAQLAKAGPQQALDRVWDLPDTKLQNAALSGVLSSLDSDDRHEAARSLYAQAPTPESQSMLARAVVNDLRIYQPEQAAAFVDSITEPDIRKSASSTLLGSWANDDPVQAMDWAASHPAGEQTNRDVYSVASRWVREDRSEMGDWLNNQPASPSLDPAVEAMVRSLRKEDPSSAMGWAESLVDAKERVSNVRSVATEWMKTDPATAAAYIANHSELTVKEKERLLR